ncbi:unnamed protein product [Amoebophrya sp. A120]|nr:unnamed protein product [Amoebophrya sp. A120]|eukprot:GSA120T00010465001.1
MLRSVMVPKPGATATRASCVAASSAALSSVLARDSLACCTCVFTRSICRTSIPKITSMGLKTSSTRSTSSSSSRRSFSSANHGDKTGYKHFLQQFLTSQKDQLCHPAIPILVFGLAAVELAIYWKRNRKEEDEAVVLRRDRLERRRAAAVTVDQKETTDGSCTLAGEPGASETVPLSDADETSNPSPHKPS